MTGPSSLGRASAAIGLAATLCLGAGGASGKSTGVEIAASLDETAAAASRALEGAPARGRLGRMRGVRIVSEVEFASAPDDPHELTLSAGFPERSRLVLASAGGAFERLQLGAGWFGRDRVAGASEEERRSYVLEGPGRLETQLDVALRRAVFFWPDEASWVGAGATRTAEVSDVGVLLATLDGSDGRPTEVRAIGRDGKVAAAFRSIEWKRGRERTWPERFEFAAAGQLLWREVVTEVTTSWNFADSCFLPSDRLSALVGHPIDARLRMRPFDARWVRRSTFETPLPLERAVRDAIRRWDLQQRELETVGLEPSIRLEVELNEERRGIASRIEVRSSSESDGPLGKAQGWTRSEAQTACARRCESVDEAASAALADLDELVATNGDPEGPRRLRFEIRPVGEERIAAEIELVQAWSRSEPDERGPR